MSRYCNFCWYWAIIGIATSWLLLLILILTLQKDAIWYHYWYWYCKNQITSIDIGIDIAKQKKKHFSLENGLNGLVYSTNIEVDIDIDVEILQNLVILRCYCYCKSTTNSIVIDIDIAEFPRLLLILILKLQTREHKYCYWYWYCKLRKAIVGIDIAVEFSLSHIPGVECISNLIIINKNYKWGSICGFLHVSSRRGHQSLRLRSWILSPLRSHVFPEKNLDFWVTWIRNSGLKSLNSSPGYNFEATGTKLRSNVHLSKLLLKA